MSKVKIQGNASGTGVLTVTAPNTSTDRTITLPDATGTLLNSDGDGSNLTGISAGPFTEVNTHKFTYTTDTNPVLQVIDSTNTVKAQMQGGNVSAVFGSASDHPVDFIQGAGEATRMRINTSGVVSVPNGIELGSGIDATAANTLDDYEEGTWTPQVKIDGSTTGITHDAQGGTYTKIGNTVILHASLSLSSKGSETGAVTFANFPFTVENWTTTTSLDGGSICFGFYSGTNDISTLGGIAVGGTSTANLYRQTSDQSQLNDTMWETKIAHGFSTRWTLIYQTTA